MRRKENDPVQAFIQGTDKGHVDLPRARAGKLAGAFFVIFTPLPTDSPERDSMYGLEFTDDGYIVSERSPIDADYARQFTDTIIAQARQIEVSANGQVEIVSDYARLQTCIETGVFAMLLHIEGAEAIRPDLSNLPDYVAQGVRSIGPVWSRRNAFGYGAPFRFPGTPDTGSGLTDAGKALIRRCNELGVIVDLAHINLAGFRDVAAISSTPLVIAALKQHGYSRTDVEKIAYKNWLRIIEATWRV